MPQQDSPTYMQIVILGHLGVIRHHQHHMPPHSPSLLKHTTSEGIFAFIPVLTLTWEEDLDFIQGLLDDMSLKPGIAVGFHLHHWLFSGTREQWQVQLFSWLGLGFACILGQTVPVPDQLLSLDYTRP